MLFKQSRARVSTGQLNRMLREAVRQNVPPSARNREPKIYYATQVGLQPPTIVLFVNDPVLISKPYQRYLLGKFRDELSFNEVPIKLYLRRRHPADVRDDLANHDENRKQTSDGHPNGGVPADAETVSRSNG
jgi:GTP-binding protein